MKFSLIVFSNLFLTVCSQTISILSPTAGAEIVPGQDVTVQLAFAVCNRCFWLVGRYVMLKFNRTHSLEWSTSPPWLPWSTVLEHLVLQMLATPLVSLFSRVTTHHSTMNKIWQVWTWIRTASSKKLMNTQTHSPHTRTMYLPSFWYSLVITEPLDRVYSFLDRDRFQHACGWNKYVDCRSLYAGRSKCPLLSRMFPRNEHTTLIHRPLRFRC